MKPEPIAIVIELDRYRPPKHPWAAPLLVVGVTVAMLAWIMGII